METIQKMKDNSILLVPSDLKEETLREIRSGENLINVKIMNESEWKKSLLFDYDIRALIYLYHSKNMKFEIAKEYVEAMYFVNENQTYQSLKLQELAQLKQELIQQGMFIFNPLFLKMAKEKEIYAYGYFEKSKEMLWYESFLNKTIILLQKEKKVQEYPPVYGFSTLKEEVDGVAYQICSLLANKININQIKLVNASSDYEFYLREYFKMYHIPVALQDATSLFTLISIRKFYQDICETKDLNYALNLYLKENGSFDPYYSTLLSSMTLFAKETMNEVTLKAILYTLKETKVKQKKIMDCVECISLSSAYQHEEWYVFILSLNQTICPKVYKNEDFLSDKEKEELRITTSYEQTRLDKKIFKEVFTSGTHIIGSFKRKSAFSSFDKAFLLNEEGIKERIFQKDSTLSFSRQASNMDLARLYDSLYQKDDSEDSAILNASCKDIPYKQYSHKFKAFDGKKIQEYIVENKINLSYTALNNYYQCGFKYYMDNLLKLKNFEPTSATDIGNLFHETLQHSDDNDFEFDKFYDSKFSEFKEPVTRFYAKKLKQTLKNIIDINKKNLAYSKLTNILKEKKVEVVYQQPITIKFKGFVDKMMYMVEDDTCYVAIIDYKTGNPDIDLNKVDFGLSLQLPIYLYLIKHTEEFKNVIIVGFYLQKLLTEGNKAGDDPLKSLENSIKLQGYSNDSITTLSKFDATYEDSKLIKSMKLTKEGKFGQYAKVLNNEQMEELACKVEKKVQEAIQCICRGEFSISPKIYNKENVSCKYCDFKNCCFYTFEDHVYLNGNKEELVEEE